MPITWNEDDPQPEPTKEECPYCGEMFKSVNRHLPYCDRNPEKKTQNRTKDADKPNLDIIKNAWDKIYASIHNRATSAGATYLAGYIEDINGELQKIK